ncbi:spermatogenesis-associated protein 22-like [Meleagris gallopavo]|uniref:spermatogenesis-associated protein 22-like n=1 Tax=Meleagris gallopavo TaxID=9103 RepID=UPI0012ABFB40|nr:spermatogenesis-associated protein 22-like [Meleagris gallopavo]
MKRSSADASTRSTAGCLPVPLFNQKKRPRQPLTSNPLKNEPGSSFVTHDSSSSSLGWGAANPEVDELQNAANNGADDHMAPSPMKSPNALKSNLVKAGRNLYAYSGIQEHPFNFQVIAAVLSNYILLMSQKELKWNINSSVPKPNSEGFKQVCNGCPVYG